VTSDFDAVSHRKLEFLAGIFVFKETLATKKDRRTSHLQTAPSTMATDVQPPVLAGTDHTPNANEEVAENPVQENDLLAEPVFLKNLRILPPLQKKGTIQKDELLDSVPLPPIRAEEPVSSIRAALSDVSGYAHFTSFRFVLETDEERIERGATFTAAVPSRSLNVHNLASPYTGHNAVISIPLALKSLENEPQTAASTTAVVETSASSVLDDYGDLTPLLSRGLSDGSCFRIVLERYDVATVRDHVVRLRILFDGNVPSVTSLAEVADEGGPPQNTDAKGETEVDAKDAEAEKSDKEEEEEKNEKGIIEADIPKYPENTSVAVDGANLHDFFYLASGEDASFYREACATVTLIDSHDDQKSKKKGSNKEKGLGNKDESPHENGHTSPPDESTLSPEADIRETVRRLNELEDRTRINCQIQFSGFHPPPPSRRLMGDLAYLEVTPPGENEDKIFITAVPTGFYVNNSALSKNGTHSFDPSPSSIPCYAHALLDCLLQRSESIRVAWLDALLASKEGAALQTGKNGDGPFLQLFRVAIRGDIAGHKKRAAATSARGIDSLIQRPSWLISLPALKESDNSWNHNSLHEYSRQRMEDDLANTFGVDIRNGALRDWNEELQSAREMPTSTLQQRIDRAR
jgi:protein TIF31